MPAAVLLGEGVWALRTVSATTSPIYWVAEIAVAVLVIAVSVARTPTLRQRIAVVSCWLLGAIAYVTALTLLF